jgi:hypothetical protein
MSPSRLLATRLAGRLVEATGVRCPAVKDECPAPRRRPGRSPACHSPLTVCPGTTPRRPRSVAGEGRAFGACCFAGKLRSPALRTGRHRYPAQLQGGDPYAIPHVNPYVIPYALGCVPLASLASASVLVSPPSRGEWSGRRRVVRFARLIHRPVRVLGGPSARAAFGGNLSLTWLPRRVVPEEHRPSTAATRRMPMRSRGSSIRPALNRSDPC